MRAPNPTMWILAMLSAAAVHPASAQGSANSALPSYVAKQHVSGTIRVWGHGAAGKDYIESLVRQWEEGFTKAQPDVHFDNELKGTASAMGALYTGKGDLAVMGREIWPVEVEAFHDVTGHDATGINVVTGSVDIRNKDFALTFVVNKDNPMAHLSLQQVLRIFSVTEKPVKTWGDLGLTGDWENRPVHLYGFEIARGFGYYLQQRAFGGSSIWNPELVELGDQPAAGGGLYDAGQRVVDAVAKAPDGIGYSSALYRSPETRILPLGRTSAGPFLLPTKRTVADHTYPLVQVITAYFDGSSPEAPAVREFLRYVLSEEGQEAVSADGGYTALTAKIAAEQRARLK